MRIGWVIPCRYVEVHQNLATIVGAGIDRVWLPELPPPEPVGILCAVRVVASHEEIDDEPPDEPEHTLVNRVYDPSMKVISELTQPFALGGTFEPQMEPAVILPIGVMFEPSEEGLHTIEIAADDRGFSVPFTVAIGQGH